jgi:predicted anti-sigma-YlaC factor YlaD
MRLDCKHVWPYLSDYIDGSVSQEEREAIELHLEHCEICSAILDSVHNILVLTADDRVFRLPVGYGDRLHARIEQELKRASVEESSNGADDGPSGG